MTKIPLLSFLFLLILNINVKAQSIYPNDDCGGAIELLFSNNSLLQDTLWLSDDMASTATSLIPHCNGSTNSIKQDMWYTFVAPDTAITICTRFIPDETGHAYIQLFSGTCASLTSIACSGTNPYTRLGNLTIGQRYIFRSYYPTGVGAAHSAHNHTLITKPINDECTGAVDIPVTSTRDNAQGRINFTNSMATYSSTACAALPSGWTNTWRDVWFKFTATATSHVVAGFGPSGTKAIIYSGQPGSFTSILTMPFTSTTTDLGYLNNLTIGNTYYIRFGAATVMNFQLAVLKDGPLNDDCSNADTIRMSNTISCENSTIVSNRILATTSSSLCTGSEKDVWYIFQATHPNITIVGGLNTSGVRFTLSSGTCGTFTCLASGGGSISYNGLTVGQYYYLQVGGNFFEHRSTSVCIIPRSTNDECVQAIGLNVQPFGTRNPTIVYSKDATSSMPPCSGLSTVEDVWYQFIATDTAHLVSIDGGGMFQLLSGSCGALNPLYCSTTTLIPAGEPQRTEKVTGLVPGNPYYLRVYAPSGVNNILSIQVSALLPNDECAGAIELPVLQTLARQFGENNGVGLATQSAAPCMGSIGRNDIWYKFTATNTTHTILAQSTGTYGSGSLLYQVYSGACGSLTSLGCFDHATTLGRNMTLSNLVPGNVYYVRLAGNVRNIDLSIISAPVNDEITGALQIHALPSAVNSAPSAYLFGAGKRFGRICNTAGSSMDHDVWFYFVATSTSHSVGTNASNSYWDEETTFTNRIEAFRGFAADSLTLVPRLIACANNTINLTNLIIGDTVYLRVASNALNSTNIFGIRLLSPQSMDEPAGAALLSKKDILELSVTTTGATQSMPASCVLTDVPDDDIWFKFIAAADIKRIVVANESIDITMQLFSGTPGNLSPILCSNNIMLLPGNLTNGNTYYLRAYSKVNVTRATFKIGLYGEDDIYMNSCNQTPVNLGPNLVANPRCEDDKYYIKGNVSNGIGVPGAPLAAGWWTATHATSDAWNADSPRLTFGNAPGYAGSYGLNKIPRSGKGMLGMLNSTVGNTEWTEYVTGRLNQPVKKGKTYFVSFYISVSEISSPHAYNFGALFNNDSLYLNHGTVALHATPQVSRVGAMIAGSTWYNVCGYFTADTDSRFVTFGNFGEHDIYGSGDNNTYIFLDDVLVSEVMMGTVPLQLMNFNGRMNAQQQSELQWMTAGENNTSRFEVEWRTETTAFAKVGTVAAAGNSAINRSYDFLHNNPAEGNNYYRLKMIDNDGQFTYSPIVKLSRENNNALFVYPNPVAQSLNVNVNAAKDETVLFKLVDNYGRIVWSRQQFLRRGSNAFNWNLSSLTGGTYYLVSTGEGHGATKILKQ